MLRCSLRRRLLASPLLGLLLVLVLTGTYLWHAESSNRLMLHLADQDLALLDRYTDQFARLSQHHMSLNHLLYEAQSRQGTDISQRGSAILDDIHHTIEAIRRLATSETLGSDLQTFAEQHAPELTEQLEAYRASVISAVETTSVQPGLAGTYLVRTNQQFSLLHATFTELLRRARAELRHEVDTHVADNRHGIYLLALGGLIVSVIILLLSYTASARLSRRLQQQLHRLNELSRSAGGESVHSDADELERISSAIEVFRGLLHTISEQEQILATKNAELLSEIEERAEAEDALLEAKRDLEAKVAERTRDLRAANDALQVEVDQRKRAELSLSLYKQVIDSTDDAVVITDSEGRIIEVNPAYERKLGYPREELIGHTPAVVRSGVQSAEFYQEMWNALTSGSHHWSGEIWNKTKSGKVLPFWQTINAVLDQDGRPSQYICLARDISELKKAEENLEQLAYYDPLTGLPNRALFNDRLHQAIVSANRHDTRLAVLFVDLDHFKEVNDTLGHLVGDALLVQVAGRLTQALRDDDTVSRLGGDEFTIILSDIHEPKNVELVADKILHSLHLPFSIGEHKVQIGASVGIALFPDHGADADRLKKNADAAMYQAKEFGRNRYQLFDAELQEESVQRRSLLKHMREALDNDGFSLHYQPIVDLASGQVDEVETLIRWQDQHGAWISPAEFIPIAEEHGLITEIDNWVLQQACQFAVRAGDSLRVHVNLSATLFHNPETPQLIFKHLDSSGLDPQRLCIEITETAVIGDPKAAREIVEQVSRRGVSFALDDFGTGYSSLTHLTRFPLQRLKIDRSFVGSMLDNEATEAVVRSMVQLAQNMGIKVVAEGVEDARQHRHLIDMGCEYGQGYHYARPMPEQALREWLLQHGETGGAQAASATGDDRVAGDQTPATRIAG